MLEHRARLLGRDRQRVSQGTIAIDTAPRGKRARERRAFDHLLARGEIRNEAIRRFRMRSVRVDRHLLTTERRRLTTTRRRRHWRDGYLPRDARLSAVLEQRVRVRPVAHEQRV